MLVWFLADHNFIFGLGKCFGFIAPLMVMADPTFFQFWCFKCLIMYCNVISISAILMSFIYRYLYEGKKVFFKMQYVDHWLIVSSECLA